MMEGANQTADWLTRHGKGYLAEAANAGRITMLTAFASALDRRPLDEQLAEFDVALARAKRRLQTAKDRYSPIPRDTLDAVGRYTRFMILAELNRAFVRSGLSIEQVASRIGWRPGQVRKFLSGKTKTQIEIVGETAFAIDGSFVQFEAEPF